MKQFIKRTIARLIFSLIFSVHVYGEASIDELKVKADAGDPSALVKLGRKYASGNGVPQDDKEALKFFAAAAEQKDPVGQAYLGEMYIRGRGAKIDCLKAEKLLLEAAEKKNAKAQLLLAILYITGPQPPKDLKRARALLNEAAAQGQSGAMRLLATMDLQGLGSKKNKESGVSWMRKAAEAGDPEAEALLGQWYLVGDQGLAISNEDAAKWVKPAAMQMQVTAMAQYGVLLLGGKGVPQNQIDGLAWMWLAANLGDKKTGQEALKVCDKLGYGPAQKELISTRAKEIAHEIQGVRSEIASD